MSRARHLSSRALGLLLLGAVAGGLRADDKLAVRFEAGYAGVLPDRAALVPVEVVIENRLQHAEGRIELRNLGETLGAEVAQVVPFVSSAPSTLRYSLLTRLEPGARRPLEARVIFDGKLPEAGRRWWNKSDQQLVLTVSVPVAYLDARDDRERKVFFSEHYQTVTMTPASLPTQSLAYDGAFAVIVAGHALAQLSRPQLEALGDWVQTGGRLMFFQPPANDKLAPLLTPLKLSGFDAQRTGVWPAGAGFVASHVLRDARERPFWVLPEQRVAAHRFLPELSQAPGWRSTPFASSGLFTNLTRRESTYGLRGFLWLLLIIVSYIVVIGPVDYWLVRRTRKPWLTWITFTSAIVGFSFLAYWYSHVVHAGTMQAIHVSVADTTAAPGPLKGNSLFWLYSTKNSVYTLSTPTPQTHFSARESGVASAVAWVKVRNGQTATMEARIPIFSAKAFDATWRERKDWQIAEVEGVSARGFVLPPAWRVRRVYLATARALTPVTFDAAAQLWVPGRESRSWPLTLEDAAGFRRAYEALPAADDLERLLITLSFASLPLADSYTEVNNTRAERSSRECELDVSPRLAGGGRLLLVFLEKASPLLPLNLDVLAPATIQADLVRIQLAAGPAEPEGEAPRPERE